MAMKTKIDLQKLHATTEMIDLSEDGRVAEMLAAIWVRMRELGMTQAALAERCNWTPPMIAAYMNGSREPGIKNLAKMATALGCQWQLMPLDPEA